MEKQNRPKSLTALFKQKPDPSDPKNADPPVPPVTPLGQTVAIPLNTRYGGRFVENQRALIKQEMTGLDAEKYEFPVTDIEGAYGSEPAPLALVHDAHAKPGEEIRCVCLGSPDSVYMKTPEGRWTSLKPNESRILRPLTCLTLDRRSHLPLEYQGITHLPMVRHRAWRKALYSVPQINQVTQWSLADFENFEGGRCSVGPAAILEAAPQGHFSRLSLQFHQNQDGSLEATTQSICPVKGAHPKQVQQAGFGIYACVERNPENHNQVSTACLIELHIPGPGPDELRLKDGTILPHYVLHLRKLGLKLHEEEGDETCVLAFSFKDAPELLNLSGSHRFKAKTKLGSKRIRHIKELIEAYNAPDSDGWVYISIEEDNNIGKCFHSEIESTKIRGAMDKACDKHGLHVSRPAEETKEKVFEQKKLKEKSLVMRRINPKVEVID